MANKEYKKYWELLKTVINRKIGECIKHRGCSGDWHVIEQCYYGYPKIKGYVARDKVKCNTDLGLFIEEKPNRGTRSWLIDHPTHKYDPCELPSNLFPELKWEDDPQEVEIIIKKIEK